MRLLIANQNPTPTWSCVRCVLVFVATIFLMGCTSSRSEDKAAVKRLTEFQDANFGVRFSHSDALSTQYNPHGGADRVMIAWRGKMLGGLRITSLPPAVSAGDFMSAGMDYYKEKYKTSSVEYRVYRNPHRYRFHRITAKAGINGADCVVERFVYLRKEKEARPDPASLESMFGAFSFEFLCREDEYEALKPEIVTVIDSFRIAESP